MFLLLAHLLLLSTARSLGLRRRTRLLLTFCLELFPHLLPQLLLLNTLLRSRWLCGRRIAALSAILIVAYLVRRHCPGQTIGTAGGYHLSSPVDLKRFVLHLSRHGFYSKRLRKVRFGRQGCEFPAG